MSRIDPDVLNEILERSLLKLQAGQDIPSILKEFPEYREELGPLLETMRAIWSSRGSDTVPLDAMVRSRERLMKAARQAKQAARPSWWRRGTGLLRHAMAPAAAVLACVALLFSGIASAQALPGSALYPMKLAAEQVILALPASPSGQLARKQEYDERRKHEVEELIQLGSHEEVNLSGFLTRGEAGEWLADGLKIEFPADLAPKALELAGQFVLVHAELFDDGRMLAETIEPRVYQVAGRVQKLESGRLMIDDIWVQVGPATQLDGAIQAGRQVEASVTRLVDNTYLALKIELAGSPKPLGGPAKTETPTIREDQPETAETPDGQDIDKHDDADAGDDEQEDEQEHSASPTPRAAVTPTIRPPQSQPNPGLTPTSQDAQDDDEKSGDEEEDGEKDEDQKDGQSDDAKDGDKHDS